MKNALFVILVAALTSCGKIKHSAYDDKTYHSLKHIHTHSLLALTSKVSTNTNENQNIHIALIADSHTNYESLTTVVNLINHTPLDFAIHLGDMTDIGHSIEYYAFLSIIENLKTPLFTVIGNHDTIGHGKNIYKYHFGDFNYFVDYKSVRFVFFNNNQLDFLNSGGIDFNWLEKTVDTSPYPVFLFQHIDPFNNDYFSEDQKNHFKQIVNKPQVASIYHGHLHVDKELIYNNKLIHQIERIENQTYTQLVIDTKNRRFKNIKLNTNGIIYDKEFNY